jgi:hypothetical protein
LGLCGRFAQAHFYIQEQIMATGTQHPKLEQATALETQAHELQQQAERLRREVYAEAQEASKALKPEFTYTIIPGKVSSWGETIHEDGFRIGREMTEASKAAYGAHMQRFGTCNIPDERISSVAYYRNRHNVLMHEGGGNLILQEGEILNDEEWAALKAGNVEPWLRKPRKPFI